jgi:hypothetical protein
MRLLLCACMLSVVVITGCGKDKPVTQGTNPPVYGAWILKGDMNSTAELVFGLDNRYQLRFPNRNESWGGIYLLSGDMIRIYDLYCGSKLPGDYQFVLKGDELTLRTAQDAYCSRSDFYPKTWIRQSKVTGKQISEWLAENPKIAEFDSVLSGKNIKSLLEADTILKRLKKEMAGS